MPYRTIKYNGETLKKLEEVIQEIKETGEDVFFFTVETY